MLLAGLLWIPFIVPPFFSLTLLIFYAMATPNRSGSSNLTAGNSFREITAFLVGPQILPLGLFFTLFALMQFGTVDGETPVEAFIAIVYAVLLIVPAMVGSLVGYVFFRGNSQRQYRDHYQFALASVLPGVFGTSICAVGVITFLAVTDSVSTADSIIRYLMTSVVVIFLYAPAFAFVGGTLTGLIVYKMKPTEQEI